LLNNPKLLEAIATTAQADKPYFEEYLSQKFSSVYTGDYENAMDIEQK